MRLPFQPPPTVQHRVTGLKFFYLTVTVYGLLLCIAVSGWLVFALHQPSIVSLALRYDFLSLYIGARAVATGHGSQLYDLNLQRVMMNAATAPYIRPLTLPYVYPAYAALVLVPLGLLPFAAAYVVWLGCNLLGVGWTLRRLIPSSAATKNERIALTVTAAGFVPLLLTLIQGQWGVVCLVGITILVLARRRGAPYHAGIGLCLALVKPQLILFPLLGLALERNWRSLIAFALGAGVVLGTSLLLLGNWPPVYFAALGQLRDENNVVGLDYPSAMHNSRALVYALFHTETSGPALALQGVLLLASLAGLLALWLPSARRPALPWEVRFALTLLLGLLTTPHLYLHDVIVALPAGLLLWQASGRALDLAATTARRWPLRLLRGVLALGPAVCFCAQLWNPPFIQLVPWYMILLLGIAFWNWSALALVAPGDAMIAPVVGA